MVGLATWRAISKRIVRGLPATSGPRGPLVASSFSHLARGQRLILRSWSAPILLRELHLASLATGDRLEGWAGAKFGGGGSERIENGKWAQWLQQQQQPPAIVITGGRRPPVMSNPTMRPLIE